MKIYKRNQGKWTRGVTAAAVLLLTIWGVNSLTNLLTKGIGIDIYLGFGIPLLVLLLIAWLTYRVLNKPKTADFLIATESEMKKVSWSSRKEVIGSTKVVIVTTFIMAALLFLVDVVFSNLFSWIGVT